MPPRRAGFRYPAGIGALFGQPPQARAPSGLVVPRVVPALLPGARTPGKMGWTPQVRPIRSPPIQGYTREVQTYIGGYGVAQATTGGQYATGTTTSLTTLTVTLPNKTTAGHTLFACIGSIGSTGSPTVSGITIGGSADNWQIQQSTGGGTGTPQGAQWIDLNCRGGQTSVVITMTGGAGTGGILAYVFEIPSVPSVVTGSWEAGPLSGTAFSNSSAISQVPSMVIAFIVAPAGTAITGPGSPWASAGALSLSTALSALAGYQVITAIAPVTYAGTLSPSASSFSTFGLAFNVPSAAATLGGAQVSLGPAGYGTRWYPNQVNIATAYGAVDTATATGYLNVIGQGGFLFQSYAGGGDQVGLAVSEMLPGDLLYIVWTGSQGNVAVQATVLGSQAVLIA